MIITKEQEVIVEKVIEHLIEKKPNIIKPQELAVHLLNIHGWNLEKTLEYIKIHIKL